MDDYAQLLKVINSIYDAALEDGPWLLQQPCPGGNGERDAHLVPHLMRAAEIRSRLEEARLAKCVQMEVLNRLPFGVIFLDDGGRIIECSRPADALLLSGQGIRAEQRRIHATSAHDDRALQRAILDTMSIKHDRPLAGTTVLVRRSEHKAPLHVAVIPAPEGQRLIPARPVCILVIFDPGASATPDVALVSRALNLTACEARLACALLGGHTLSEAAAGLGRSVNTCKSQLKSIYVKTGCRNHTELAQCLLQIGLAEGFRVGA